MKKQELAKGFANTFANNVEILNSLNPKMQLEDIDSTIKIQLVESLAQLKGFRFVASLVLVFKKIKSKNKTKYDNFY